MVKLGKTVQKQDQQNIKQQTEDAKARNKVPVNPKPVPQAEKPKPVQAAAASGSATVIPAGIDKDDIVNPENQSMLRSVAYCTYRVPSL